ncbi:RagB/SusD family nutrient uptake outer membrane protein [Flexithrix dorotheae]|uniref:RagB/SusD family nutrient uptake outer membrane protein n=1 Tax=Flexithrix dorotheae TaxID=70993 RepID=UPI0012FB486D|nr:RagB/SusD family nutrient uptake outer membrane protein [Flexithrix dorotheae]
MNSYKLILLFVLVLSSFVGCDDLEYEPIDQLTEEQVANDPELLLNVTFGTYGKLKENQYLRYDKFCKELMSDDVILVKTTGDNLMHTYTYGHTVASNSSRQVWTRGYQAIYSANKVIEAIDESSANDKVKQILGENYFLRALIHHDLVRYFARPYTNVSDPENELGIMLRTDTNNDDLPGRSSLKESYDLIVSDLIKAANLMSENKSNAFASKEVAYALLARMYLYMGDNDNAITYADNVINSGRYELLQGDDYSNYFRLFPEENSETIFCFKVLPSENYGKSSLGSMFNGFGGWGEIYASTSYRNLLYKYPEDRRIDFIEPHFETPLVEDPTEDAGYTVQKRNGLAKYYHVKYTNEGGNQMLSSPIRLRLAEMYLIKAEALAKKGQDAQAIEIVDLLRTRAGLSGNQLFQNDMQGYTSAFDIVMDERRLELAFEGHRSFDVFRNKMTMDRTYTPVDVSWDGPRTISHTSNLIVHLIHESEIALNPKLVQNPID